MFHGGWSENVLIRKHLHYIRSIAMKMDKKSAISSYFVALFQKGQMRAVFQIIIFNVYGSDAVTDRVCQK